ncbi:MAG TPA: hypothetical protein EYP85_04715 [Armatimonadetes bacterium]|nr:hypothetical protein [Armatimonadota bacterium]
MELQGFDEAAWEQTFGRVPFHFLSCSLPGAEIFHQRGWPIPTPVIDPYPLHNQATGYGRQITSHWSPNWTYAPPLGAHPLATVGLWKPSARRYVAYDFHGARLTDHSEKNIGTAYCWELKGAEALKQFFTLVWPYARPYQELRYPQLPEQGVVASHFRLLYHLNLPSDEDPNYFVQQFIWNRYSDRMPAVPPVNDVSWYPNPLRLNSFPPPGAGRLYRRLSQQEARWFKPGALVAGGIGWDGDPLTYLYETGQQATLDQLKADVDFLLPYAQRLEIEGDECYFWQKPLEGEGIDLFGPGVPTLHNIQGWQIALTLLDLYRNEPETQARLLPYIDGALRYTKHILYTRNGYADVPAAQFCWGAGPVTTFCLRYYYTFRDAPDPEHRALAQEAYHLAHRLLYRYLPIWASDSDEMDELDSSFFLEPNAGVSWLGAACSNEVWTVAYALAQVYVATGDELLSHYLRGALERWHELFRDEYYPTVAAYDHALTERLGLFDGAQQAKGTRATFGGIWGLFERLSWPLREATVRVLCGEKAALVFTKNGRHTNLADYRYYGGGDFSFRLRPTAQWARQEEPFAVVVTFPYFDLRKKPLFRWRGGERTALRPEEDYQTFPTRPDTLYLPRVRYGDTLAIGHYDPAQPPLPCPIAKPRQTARATDVRGPSDFTLVDLTPVANRTLPLNWDDPKSWAGWEPGRKLLYGVPFDLLEPLYNEGKIAVRDAEVPVNAGGKHLFVLFGEAEENARLTAVWAKGKETPFDLRGALPVLKGWPPCFEWHVDLVEMPLKGQRVRSLRAQGVSVFAATVYTGPPARLAATLEALGEKREAILAEWRASEGLRKLAPLFEQFSRRIAILPDPRQRNPQANPLVRILHRAGLLEHFVLLTPQQLVDEDFFSPQRFWIALYLGGEHYYQTVNRSGDGDEAILRFLRGGGTLLVLPTQPFPFYYNEQGRVVVSAPKFGLPICGSGAHDRPEALAEADLRGWEDPPAGHTFTFTRRKQDLLTAVPKQFPFPEKGDDRWRPIANVFGEEAHYLPLLSLYDETGRYYGEGGALIEFRQGEFAGAKVLYLWCTLVHHPDYRTNLVADVFRYLLTHTLPPPAQAVCLRTDEPVQVDGRLDEPIWAQTPPLPLTYCLLTRQGSPTYPTEVRCAWDAENLYLAFVAEDPDIWSEFTHRDANLWEAEVVEVYLDPDGDGRNYKEFEVSPRNVVVDLNIPQGPDIGDVDENRRWNAPGWRTAVRVEGSVDQREDRDARWTVEMALPFADLFRPAPPALPRLGEVWRVQFYRIERPREGKPEFSSWSATDAFHNPRRFGRLIFGANPYRDDFSLYPDGSSGWPTWRVQAGTWRTEEGVFLGQDSGTDAWNPRGVRVGEESWRDYRVRLRFQIRQRGSDHRDGVWIGVRQRPDGSGYSLNLHASGARLHKFHQGRGTNDDLMLARAEWTPDREWHTLALMVRQNELRAELDGQLLLQATDDDFLGVPPVPSGYVILSARRWSRSQGHTLVAFDDFSVEGLE